LRFCGEEAARFRREGLPRAARLPRGALALILGTGGNIFGGFAPLERAPQPPGHRQDSTAMRDNGMKGGVAHFLLNQLARLLSPAEHEIEFN
jgi:hypothetical protein